MKTKTKIVVALISIQFALFCGHLSSQNSIEFSSSSSFTTGYEIPFFEDWNSGTFDANQWTVTDPNWQIIPQTGNPAPSAKFSASPSLSNYSSSLDSYIINTEATFIGKIYLKFDLKLADFTESGTEYLNVKINNELDTVIIFSSHNVGSFEWITITEDITELVVGNNFTVSYEATGESSSKIVAWYIDNIEIYRECDEPKDLVGGIEWYSTNNWGGEISWTAPPVVFSRRFWKGWCEPNCYDGIGLTNGGDFSVATRWDEGMLDDYEGARIQSLRFFPRNLGFNYLIIKIWEGENAMNLLYSDTLYNTIAGEWNEHPLEDTMLIDPTKEYWVGYDIIGQEIGFSPAGTDLGPAIEGYGDMIKTAANPQWEQLSQLGLDRNWSIQMFIDADPVQDPETLLGFNVLRKINTEPDYSPFDFVEFIPDQELYNSFDNRPDLQGIYDAWYKVNCQWGNQGDTCISDFAQAYENPGNDFIWLYYDNIGIGEVSNNEEIKIFPNPASTSIVISSTLDINNVTIINFFGQIVHQTQMISTDNLAIDVSDFKAGNYMIIIETNSGVSAKKFVKL